MNDCIICYDEGINLIKPSACNCLVFMHNNCYTEMKNKLGIICPICRKKEINIPFNNDNVRIIAVEFRFPRNVYTIVYCVGFFILLSLCLFFYFVVFIFKNSLIILPCFFIYYIIF